MIIFEPDGELVTHKYSDFSHNEDLKTIFDWIKPSGESNINKTHFIRNAFFDETIGLFISNNSDYHFVNDVGEIGFEVMDNIGNNISVLPLNVNDDGTLIVNKNDKYGNYITLEQNKCKVFRSNCYSYDKDIFENIELSDKIKLARPNNITFKDTIIFVMKQYHINTILFLF